MVESTYGLKAWIERISNEDLSTLAGTVCNLQSIIGDDEASLFEVSQAILSDPNLTSRVLRIANSANYNPTGISISTVSRATVVLGISVIRNLCISVKVIDELLSRSKHERLFSVMARSLHTAVLSRRLWAKWRGGQIEEVFIAGLLLHLGEAVYWSLDDITSGRLEERLYAGRTVDEACHEVLGIRFNELGLGLVRAWQLGDLTLEVHRRPRDPGPSAGLILLADRLVMTWHGADPDERAGIYRDMAKLLEGDPKAVAAECEAVIQLLPEVADEFGAPALKPYLPLGGMPVDCTVALSPLAGDQGLQLSILREMCLMSGERADLNALIAMALEGMHRGVGLDRVVIFIVSSDGKRLSARSAMGRIATGWKESFQFQLDKSSESFFGDCLKKGLSRWVGQEPASESQRLSDVAERLQVKAGQSFDAFLAPMVVGGKVIGAFYADCAPSGRQLKAEDFAAFRHFAQQVTLSAGMR